MSDSNDFTISQVNGSGVTRVERVPNPEEVCESFRKLGEKYGHRRGNFPLLALNIQCHLRNISR